MDLKTTIREFVNLPVRASCEWHGGVFPFADVLGDRLDRSGGAGSEMSDASMLLWVALDTGLVHGKPETELAPLELLVRGMNEFLKIQGIDHRPTDIGLTNHELVEPLSELLAGSGTNVFHAPDSGFWNEVKGDMAQNLSGTAGDGGTAPSIAESDLTDEQVTEFAIAAAEFYRAAIWKHLNDADLLKVTSPRPPKMLKHVTVLGNGRQEYGLGFYASPEIHWEMRTGKLDIRSLEIFSLTFVSTAEVGDSDVAMWKELELPLESGDAFPLFLHVSPDGMQLPGAKQFEFVTVLLKSLALTTEEELDSGKWEKGVACLGKTKTCKLTIPDLLDPPKRVEWLERGMIPEPRGNERHHRMIQEVMQQNENMSLDDINEMLKSQFTGSIDDFDYPSETPFDRADSLSYAAIDNYGRRRIQLARQALDEDPTHVEANNLVAELTFDFDLRIERFQMAVALGAKQNEDLLASEVGHFWDLSQTRPFIRAKYGLANAYESNGQRNEAIQEMLDMLRLDSSDHLGVRYEVIPVLLIQDRDAEVVEILNRYDEDTTSWLFHKAMIEYRINGSKSKSAQSAISKAIRANLHVIELLQAGEPPMMPSSYVLGSPEEAATVMNEQLESWLETEGFMEWMIGQVMHVERELINRQRNLKRKLRTAKKKKKR